MSNSNGYEMIRTLIKFYEVQDKDIQKRITEIVLSSNGSSVRLIETIAKVCDD